MPFMDGIWLCFSKHVMHDTWTTATIHCSQSPIDTRYRKCHHVMREQVCKQTLDRIDTDVTQRLLQTMILWIRFCWPR